MRGGCHHAKKGLNIATRTRGEAMIQQHPAMTAE
jgi:hypothetical protein